ncbi:MAG: hypothetical protein H0T42_31425 [Deltaproteobacteria bacterium]|nr:hypothetical protein [Deltaproteobacteria bacterium]
MALLTGAALALTARAEAQRQPGWEVRVAERIEVAPGASGAIAISIAVDRGLTVSKDAAVIVDLIAPAGITLRKRRLGRGEAVDPEADAPRFAVPVRATEAGEHALKIRMRFWVCGGKACRPVDVRRSAVVVVAAPSAPVVPPADAGTGGAP